MKQDEKTATKPNLDQPTININKPDFAYFSAAETTKKAISVRTSRAGRR